MAQFMNNDNKQAKDLLKWVSQKYKKKKNKREEYYEDDIRQTTGIIREIQRRGRA